MDRFGAVAIGWATALTVIAQADVQTLQALTKATGPPAAKADGKSAQASAKGKEATKDATKGANVAEAEGPINVRNQVRDDEIARFLKRTLPRFPGVRSLHIEVQGGVVTLTGQVADDDVRDRLRDVCRRVQGVVVVINDTKTDAEVLTAPEFLMRQLNGYRDIIAKKWLLALLALTLLFGAAALARLVGRHAETILAPFTQNMLLRSVLGSVLSGAILLGGLFAALSALGLTQAVLSIVGLAGVVALAVGFAFRDITENFISSVLLGVRRPFRLGDYIQIAGYAGVVRSLNTRATVLVTLEGDHVRIPNSVVYKEIMINKSASNTSRQTFDVLVPFAASTAEAADRIARAIADLEGVVADPPPRALVEALDGGNVRLRVYYWIPTQGVDGFKIASDARLRTKLALQEAGITPPAAGVTVSVVGRVPLELHRADGESEAERQARRNLHRDRRAAQSDGQAREPDRPTPMEHALEQPLTCASDEGENLLKNGSQHESVRS